MKTIALFTILLLASCASSTGVIDKRSFNCKSGNDIEVRAGLEDPLTGEGAQLGQLVFLVEVANNSAVDLTVDSISIDPVSRGGVELQGVSKTFKQDIASATEGIFRLPASDWGKVLIGDQSTLPRRMEFRVTVRLTNGDTYRCPFYTDRQP